MRKIKPRAETLFLTEGGSFFETLNVRSHQEQPPSMMMKYVHMYVRGRGNLTSSEEQESIRVQNGFFGTELTSSYGSVDP